MKTMIHTLAYTALLSIALSSCNDDNAPILTQKDWDNTATYFKPTDENMFGTYYKPQLGYVGDPMPFYDPQASDFKIMYLQEYRPNQTTYHPFWAVSTKNGGSYTSLGELIPTGTEDEPDAALGTGCIFYDETNKVYYTYYTGHTADTEVVMRATSTDFKTWNKDRTFFLLGSNDGYSRKDFRDPFIFESESGKYHMIVSTKKDGIGVLAEYTSTDLKAWKHSGVFMPMHWGADRFYECADVFKMGDWWYLVYSDQNAVSRKVCYFKGSTLEELKQMTAAPTFPDNKEGVLDSRAFYAGKTASNGTDRYIWGWCPTRAGNDNTAVGAAPAEPEWAGNLVMHKIIQHEDGTLSLGSVDGILNKYTNNTTLKVMAQSETGVAESNDNYTLSGDAYVLFNRLNVHNKLTFTVTASSNEDIFGISLARGTDSKKYYSLIINPEDNNSNRKINFEQKGKEGIGFIAGIDGYKFPFPADNIYHVTICTDNSVCTVYINDNVAYTNRIYGIQKNCWSLDSYEGSIQVSNIKVSYY